LNRELLKEYKVYEYKKIKEKETGDEKYIIDGVRTGNLANLIKKEFYPFVTIRDKTKEILYQNEGVYRKNGETIILEKTEELLEQYSTTHIKNEVVCHIRDSNYVERDIFITSPNLIPVANGVFDIKSNKLRSYTTDDYFLNKTPANYNPKAKCKEFEKFLQHICMQDGKRRKNLEKTIQEYMGYSLYRSYLYKKYVVLDGSGDNAKTTLLNVVLALVGTNNNTSVSLQELNDRPFTKSKLYGKLTNVSDDLPKKGLKYSGTIKQITGNSPLWADIKNHPEGIEFTSYSKPWYACNELPETPDLTDAFFSRQLQITLLNKYVKKEEWKLVDNKTIFKADPRLIEKLVAELSGILNFALVGLRRLLKNGYFSDRQTTEERRETWLKKTNPIHAFIEDEIEFVPDWAITTDDFYNEILAYCERNGFDKPTKHKVTSKMGQESSNIGKQQKTINKIPRVWCWIGVRSTTDNTINHYFGRSIGEQQEVII